MYQSEKNYLNFVINDNCYARYNNTNVYEIAEDEGGLDTMPRNYREI